MTTALRKYLEPRVEIELEHVDRERRAVDLVRAQPLCRHPDVVPDSEVEAQDVAFGVRSAEAEVGVRERVEHGVALEVAISREHAPVLRPGDQRAPDVELELVA